MTSQRSDAAPAVAAGGPGSGRGGGTRSVHPGAAAGTVVLVLLLTLSLLAVAALTLAPVGSGWAWGSPVEELQWYATLTDEARRQLVGNALLLAPAAALATVLWPRKAAGGRPVHLALAAGGSIELLQWALPLGRVVSPLDAALNAAGALAAARLTVAIARSLRAPAPAAPQERADTP